MVVLCLLDQAAYQRIYKYEMCDIRLYTWMTSLVKIVSAHYLATPPHEAHTSYITHNHSLTLRSSSFIICKPPTPTVNLLEHVKTGLTMMLPRV